MRESIEKVIEKYALQNAIKYDSTPLADAVMGKVLSECPGLRTKTREIMPLILGTIEKISSMTSAERFERLQKIAPELTLSKKKEKVRGLPPLEFGESVKMRIAPNPNGPPTLGTARGIVINHEYTQMYSGKFILRLDDTDPKIKKPMLEAYRWYEEDCEWLDAKPDETVIASDRIDKYYQYAEKLIKMDKAYVCFCDRDEFKIFKDSMRACPHREQDVNVNLKYWKKMLAGKYEEREAVLRIKTNIKHKDPALRDWVALRIVKEAHPRAGRKYDVWPMLDFESAMEDHLLGITHIIRGKDLMDSGRRQKFVYDYFGWKYPNTSHWGRIKIHEFGKFSTSEIKIAIDNGEYKGWDDPRLPTVRALRRRGIQAKAIRNFMIDLGVSETDIAVSMDTLYAENRKIIDPIANRYFFVWNPIKLEIKDAIPTVAKAPLHPTGNRGFREILVKKEVFVCKDDIQDIKKGDKLRLKDLYNIQITSLCPLNAKYIGNDLGITKQGAAIIHWCPSGGVKVKVICPDKEYNGIGESGISSELGNVVQFERFGFVKIDSIYDKIVAYFAHK
ncbi:glutamate--tRNA ligase [Halobacteriota archaeon]